MKFRSRVPHHRANVPLLEYLAARFTYHSAREWEELIGDGRVLVDGLPGTPGQIVLSECEVAYLPEPFVEPQADLHYRVVYEDEWLLGVDKPGNLLVHRAGKAVAGNLIALIRAGACSRQWPDAVAINRLDRETSGVVLVAKRAAFVRPVTGSLRRGDACKLYRAVVQCRRAPEEGIVDAPVGHDPQAQESYRYAVVAEGGREARSVVEKFERLDECHGVLTLRAVTGRTHQLRVHCAHIGCPIIGDRLYGVNRGSEGQGPYLHRQALHCTRTSFFHPYLCRMVSVEAPLAADMAALIARLGGTPPGRICGRTS
jgi:23S rRNA pseudouridine1911/1915/1917 synthase